MFLDKLQKNWIIKQSSSTFHEKPKHATVFSRPLIIMKKKDSIKVVLDARYFNSNTDQSSESWPLEPQATQTAETNKEYKSAIGLKFACTHATLDDETYKVTEFSSRDKFFAFNWGFHRLKGFPVFHTTNDHPF